MDKTVSIFLAGVQKAGTTSMHAYLAAHPALSPARVKETHFFDDESVNWNAPDYTTYHAFFGPIYTRAFDATPIYTFWPPALDRIKRYNAASRLIVLLRDPIERAYSHWAMERDRRKEPLTFGEAIRAGRLRLPASSPLHPAWRTFSYVERGFYADQIRRALHLFPRNQLLFIDSADLRRYHSSVLQRVAAFLGLPPFPPLPARLDHAGPAGIGPEPRDVTYLRELFAADVMAVSSLTGLDVSGWLTLKRDEPTDGGQRPHPEQPRLTQRD